MPIEIRELIIRMTVNKTTNLHHSNGSKSGSEISRQQLNSLKKEIIEECLEKTIDLMEKKSNR